MSDNMSKKFSEHFMCPLPWNQVFYSNNSPTPCTMMKLHINENMTIEEYLESDFLKNIKESMEKGIAPVQCNGCKSREDAGMRSMRSTFWNYHFTGEEPLLRDQAFRSFKANKKEPIARIELRHTNLCNMMCRHCDEISSSMIAKEKLSVVGTPDELKFVRNIDKLKFAENYVGITKLVPEINESLKRTVVEARNQRVGTESLFHLCFTGGEPFLIKEYYEFLDFCIENKVHEYSTAEVYTNASVYSPEFVEKLSKFRHVVLNVSVDSVGKAAEYIRHGKPWDLIKKNILSFNQLKKPFIIRVNSAITGLSLLNTSELAKFYLELLEQNKNIKLMIYTSPGPVEVNYASLPQHLRPKAIEEIDKAIEILSGHLNFQMAVVELKKLKNRFDYYEPVNSQAFIDKNTTLDNIRGMSFEDTFGLKLTE